MLINFEITLGIAYAFQLRKEQNPMLSHRKIVINCVVYAQKEKHPREIHQRLSPGNGKGMTPYFPYFFVLGVCSQFYYRVFSFSNLLTICIV